MSRLSPTLRANLVRYGLGEDDAEDVVQEVFARALAYRPGFPTARDFARWATIVARNLAYDRLRELERVEPADIPQPPLPDPAEEVERLADVEAIVQAYESLSESDRRVLYAAAYETRPEDAEERTRFRWWLNRARARMRGRMRGWLVALPLRWRDRWQFEHVVPTIGGALLVIELAAGATGPSSSALNRLAPPPITHVTTNAVAPVGGSVPTSQPQLPPVRRPSIRDSPTTTTSATADPSDSPGGRVHYERVEVRAPGGSEPLAVVGTYERESENPPLICLRNLPLLGTNCVQK